MKIVIAGRNVGVTESMKAYARAKVEKLRKYFDRITRARVTLDVNHDSNQVEVVIDVTRGVSLVGKADAPDMYAALDLAEQKLAGQLRRFKQRLQSRRRGESVSALTPRPGDERDPEATAEESQTYEDVIERMRQGE